MRCPLGLAEVSEADYSFTGHLCGSSVVKRSMYTMCVVVLPKSLQFLRKIIGISEECVVKKFPTNRSNQSLDEWM